MLSELVTLGWSIPGVFPARPGVWPQWVHPSRVLTLWLLMRSPVGGRGRRSAGGREREVWIWLLTLVPGHTAFFLSACVSANGPLIELSSQEEVAEDVSPSNLFLINFYWTVVDLQCCISFCCTAKWISYTHTYEYWVEFPVLYSRFLLVIYFISSSVCMSWWGRDFQ